MNLDQIKADERFELSKLDELTRKAAKSAQKSRQVPLASDLVLHGTKHQSQERTIEPDFDEYGTSQID